MILLRSLAGVAELADARDSKSRTISQNKPSQQVDSSSGYGDSTQDIGERLGVLLGALAAEIAHLAPDLADVLTAWPTLPEAVKAGIKAMVTATAAKGNAEGPRMAPVMNELPTKRDGRKANQ